MARPSNRRRDSSHRATHVRQARMSDERGSRASKPSMIPSATSAPPRPEPKRNWRPQAGLRTHKQAILPERQTRREQPAALPRPPKVPGFSLPLQLCTSQWGPGTSPCSMRGGGPAKTQPGPPRKRTVFSPRVPACGTVAELARRVRGREVEGGPLRRGCLLACWGRTVGQLGVMLLLQVDGDGKQGRPATPGQQPEQRAEAGWC
jgi:hypothetical protein